MIETRLLQQFIAVAEELHFNRAAERLHMAQPPLSQAIRRLEAEIGFALFERNNRSVALTPAGHSFLQTARQILLSLDEGVMQSRRVAQGIEGHIRLTFINIVPYVPLLKVLREFREKFPQVELSMQEATTDEQIEALERGTADIGFMRKPGRTTPHLSYVPIFREQIYVVMPVGHVLQAQMDIQLAALVGADFVASSRSLGQGFHDQLIALCLTAGFQPKIVQQARQLHTLIALVAMGVGVALVPASLLIQGREDVVFRPLVADIPNDLLYLDLFMTWNRTASAPARDHLITAIREAMSLDKLQE